MVANYAALGTAWQLLCEFADLPVEQGKFMNDLTAVMNAGIPVSKIIFDEAVVGSEGRKFASGEETVRFPTKVTSAIFSMIFMRPGSTRIRTDKQPGSTRRAIATPRFIDRAP